MIDFLDWLALFVVWLLLFVMVVSCVIAVVDAWREVEEDEQDALPKPAKKPEAGPERLPTPEELWRQAQVAIAEDSKRWKSSLELALGELRGEHPQLIEPEPAPEPPPEPQPLRLNPLNPEWVALEQEVQQRLQALREQSEALLKRVRALQEPKPAAAQLPRLTEYQPKGKVHVDCHCPDCQKVLKSFKVRQPLRSRVEVNYDGPLGPIPGGYEHLGPAEGEARSLRVWVWELGGGPPRQVWPRQ
jgi:hypothetical protein